MDTIAIYLRLSSEDGDLGTASKETSNSISNQRKLIADYISSNSDLEKMKIEEYIDDGYSGTNFNRPSFQRLLKDAKSGSIDVIITKDFSRLGRDYLEVGNYLEYIFPILGIRYISVNDAFDSYNTKGMTGGMSVALKNIINSMYSEDLSKKVCAAQKVKAANGEVVSAFVHYGYMKDPNDNHKMIIDPEAADVVRLIYNLAEQGMGFAEIARRLNSMGVPSITQYFINKGCYKNFHGHEDKTHFWTGASIADILRNESYEGYYIWGRTDQSLKIKRSQNTRCMNKPKEEWIRIPNHHEAIISIEQFERVQKKINNKRKTTPANIVSRKKINLYRCPYCKRKLSTNKKKVCCSTASLTLNEECKAVSSDIEKLEDTIVVTFNKIVEFVLDCTQKLMKKGESYDIIQENILSCKKELDRIPVSKMKQYDLYKLGKITVEQYQTFVEELHSLKCDLEEKLVRMKEEQMNMKEACKNLEQTQEIANDMYLNNGYDPIVISKFVKYIDVYSESEIEIFFDVDDVFFNKMISELE